MKFPTAKSQAYHHSPLRYPGGKSFLLPLFDELIGASSLSNVTYVEPFAGGAGVALALLFTGCVQRIVINDLDSAIYSFWTSAVHQTTRFITRLRETPISVSEWRHQRDVYHDPRSSRFALGFAAFYLNRTNRSGFLGGGPIGGLAQSGEWKINARFNKKTLVARLRLLRDFRDRIVISNSDGIGLLDDYLADKHAFIYLDPPYFEKGRSLYLNHYELADHERLSKRLNSRPNAMWALTYDSHPTIRRLYRHRRKISFSLSYNAYEPRQGSEILILSDALTKAISPTRYTRRCAASVD